MTARRGHFQHAEDLVERQIQPRGDPVRAFWEPKTPLHTPVAGGPRGGTRDIAQPKTRPRSEM
jgi:hypothetical protein